MSMHVEKYCNLQKYGCSMASLAVRRSYKGKTIQDIKHALILLVKENMNVNMNKDVRIIMVNSI